MTGDFLGSTIAANSPARFRGRVETVHISIVGHRGPGLTNSVTPAIGSIVHETNRFVRVSNRRDTRRYVKTNPYPGDQLRKTERRRRGYGTPNVHGPFSRNYVPNGVSPAVVCVSANCSDGRLGPRRSAAVVILRAGTAPARSSRA